MRPDGGEPGGLQYPGDSRDAPIRVRRPSTAARRGGRRQGVEGRRVRNVTSERSAVTSVTPWSTRSDTVEADVGRS